MILAIFSGEEPESQSNHLKLKFNYVTSYLKTCRHFLIAPQMNPHSAHPPPPTPHTQSLPALSPAPYTAASLASARVSYVPSSGHPVNPAGAEASSWKAAPSPSAGWLLHSLKISASMTSS